jgi:hypothetical protein
MDPSLCVRASSAIGLRASDSRSEVQRSKSNDDVLDYPIVLFVRRNPQRCDTD